jgi:hypothetical protein
MNHVFLSAGTELGSPDQALTWVTCLVGISCLVGTMELASARSSLWGTNGALPWRGVRLDHARLPRALRVALDVLFCPTGFAVVIAARGVASSVLLLHPADARAATVASWLLSLLVSVRFRGRENGANDAMLNLVLAALSVAHLVRGVIGTDASGDDVAGQALVFIAAQTLWSYVAAGLTKLRTKEWRAGTAVGAFVSVPRLGAPRVARALASPTCSSLAGWVVMAWQLSTPLTLLSTSACLFYCVTGLGFHLANFALFGLNRFVFTWAATYPAVIYCAMRLDDV